MKPRKSIVSRYKKTTVNPNYFGSIDISNTGDTNISIGKVNEQGYIYMPYIPVMTTPEIIGGFFEPTPEEVRAEREKKIKRIFNG